MSDPVLEAQDASSGTGRTTLTPVEPPSAAAPATPTTAPPDAPPGDGKQRPEGLTPREIVAELDRFVVGQRAAKRAVAIALRNRQRRQILADDLREEVVPKNIIMIGPTGVGKTEIARRLARLTNSPFLKVEASKFTEVGYVGRDAESMVRDLTDVAVKMVREERTREVEGKAEEMVEERLLQLLLPAGNRIDVLEPSAQGQEDALRSTREKLREQLRSGRLDERRVEIEVHERVFAALPINLPPGMEELDGSLQNMLPGLFGGRQKKRKVKVAEARVLLLREEAQKLVDMEAVATSALERVEQSGIVFLDEIDKIAGRESQTRGPDVSREGVQRDLLPIIEGTTVNTKYGMVKTDHILFIAAGAFHVSKPADLIPELQGRFPIRVELEPLTKEDFVRILTEPQGALTKQYVALLGTEGVTVSFEPGAVELIAEYAALANERAENIGARRLHTVMELLLDEIAFDAPDRLEREVRIDAAYVRDRLLDVVRDADLARYIL